MDPDQALADLRKAIEDWERADGQIPVRAHDAAERAISAAAALDSWLSHGGFLPQAWSHPVRRGRET